MISLRSVCPGALIAAAAGLLPVENASRRLQVPRTFLMRMLLQGCFARDHGRRRSSRHVCAFWVVTFCRTAGML
eukprot:s1325_g14.t1